jgi:polyisoprenoid-binding protein YceI
MHKHTRSALVVSAALAFALGAAAPAGAEVREYRIDTSHSSVTFAIRHFFTKVPGSFNRFSGAVSFDPADLSTAKVTAEIDAASIDTNKEERDKHLRSADFFDVEKLPTIRFESTSAAVTGKDQAKVLGNLTMHGVTRPVELQATSLGSLIDPWGNQRAGFEARTTIQRKDFGIVWNKVLDAGSTMLGDEVDVTISLELVAKKPEPPAGEAKAPAAEGSKPAAPASR